MDPFNFLPFTVLLAIAKNVPDLPSLHSLRVASPVCSALLTENTDVGTEIVEAVAVASMAEENRAVLGQILRMLRHPPPSWNECIRQLSQTSRHPLRARCRVSAKSITQLLALVKVVHRAAHRCLHTLLQRYIALRPERVEDHTFSYENLRYWQETNGRPYEAAPVPKSVAVDIDFARATGQLEWIEEQRAINGALQLAVFSVLRDIAETGGTWPGDDTEYLLHIGPIGLWSCITAITPYTTFNSQMIETIMDDPTATSATLPVHLRDVYQSAPICSGACCSPHVGPMSLYWRTGYGDIVASRRAAMFFSAARNAPWSPLRGTGVKPFRYLGFMLWNEDRFAAMGLHTADCFVNSRFRGVWELAQYHDMFAWKSVFTATQLEELETEQRAAWPFEP